MAAMRFVAAIFLFALMLGFACPAHADLDQVEAKEVARNNNCPPKKIDVYQTSVGAENATIYRVECNLPKATNDAVKTADTLMIRCDASLCQVLHPVMPESK
jgi:hypothetical protein